MVHAESAPCRKVPEHSALVLRATIISLKQTRIIPFGNDWRINGEATRSRADRRSEDRGVSHNSLQSIPDTAAQVQLGPTSPGIALPRQGK